MYCDEIYAISKAENGFILNLCCPIKPEKPAKKSDCCVTMGKSEGEAKYVCKDVEELFAKIKETLPKLDVSYSSEEAFEKAFKAATMSED